MNTTLLVGLSFAIPSWPSVIRGREGDVSESKKENSSSSPKGELVLSSFPPSSPCTETTSSGNTRNSGVINLLLIVLLVGNIAHFEHFSYRETFINVAGIYNGLSGGWQSAVILFACVNLSIVAAYLFELAALWKLISERTVQLLQALNSSLVIIFSSFIIVYTDINIGLGIATTISVCCVFMKLVSYAQVNSHERNTFYIKSDYPENLSLRNLYYFLFLPTLCYRIRFPKADTIRIGFVMRRIMEIIVLSVSIVAIVEHFYMPVVLNSTKYAETLDIVGLLEVLLQLTVPNILVWLMGFYAFFHSYLNLLGELFMYRKRVFYRDWWNSCTIDDFWRNWNLPVHEWMVHHVYRPLRRNFKVPSTWALIICFTVSAFFHEWVLSVTFKSLHLWAFAAMMAQIPLIQCTRFIGSSSFGNFIFWFSVTLGQPLAVMLYYFKTV